MCSVLFSSEKWALERIGSKLYFFKLLHVKICHMKYNAEIYQEAELIWSDSRSWSNGYTVSRKRGKVVNKTYCRYRLWMARLFAAVCLLVGYKVLHTPFTRMFFLLFPLLPPTTVIITSKKLVRRNNDAASGKTVSYAQSQFHRVLLISFCKPEW